jgi:hypothetical protein
MNRHSVCLLLLVLAAMTASGSAIAFRGGGGGGGFHGGGFHGGGFHGGGFHGGRGFRGSDFRHGGFGHFHRGCCGGSVGFFFGADYVYGYPYPYYPYPYAYYPYWTVGNGYGPPSQYVEPGQGGEVPSMAYWYRCTQPEGYYPYVRTCPGGWRKVPAQPPGT